MIENIFVFGVRCAVETHQNQHIKTRFDPHSGALHALLQETFSSVIIKGYFLKIILLLHKVYYSLNCTFNFSFLSGNFSDVE